jgi:hypothetical protein
VNFHRQLLPHAAVTQAPLHDDLSGTRVKGSDPITWTAELHKALEECKASFSRATLLAHPIHPRHLHSSQTPPYPPWVPYCSNASRTPRIPNFFSKKFNPAQQKYSAYGREMLATYEAVKHFRHTLKARYFVIITNHKPIITYAFQKRDKWSPRQFNLDFVALFTTDI